MLSSVRATWKRLEAYVLRLPLLTRVVILAISAVHFFEVIGVPVSVYFALDPKVMGLDQMHRLNTYPLVHTGLMHCLMNIFALTPLLERFEREIGTLKCLLLIAGPIVTFPAALYLLIEMGLLQGRQEIMGASALVFTFLANEAIKTFAFQPYYTIVGYEFPSWITPIFWMMLATFLVPSSNLLGHFCGLVVGYAYACRYLRLLEPSEWILTKVEKTLAFVLLRLPWYVSLEKRTEMNYMEILPMVSPRAGGSGAAEEGFGGAGGGRPLGGVQISA